MSKKIAIVLMNLGGPDNLSSVKEFLFNLFYDKAIINLPNPFRWIVAKIISSRREKYSQEVYSQIGGKSPILEETEKQKKAIENMLSSENSYKIFIHMRYFKPGTEELKIEIEKFSPEEILLVPLYPQFSTTTTDSSVKEIKENLKSYKIKSLCCYHDDELFIESHVENILSKLDKSKLDNSIILFSAHGIPQKLVDQGDPYQFQIESTVKNIIEKINIPNLNYKITYQSRVGPLKWLQPYTEEEIISYSKEGKIIYIVPIAFVSEHVETLVELDVEYKMLAKENGCSAYIRINALGDSKKYIESLVKNIKKMLEQENEFFMPSGNYCSSNYKKCICRNGINVK